MGNDERHIGARTTGARVSRGMATMINDREPGLPGAMAPGFSGAVMALALAVAGSFGALFAGLQGVLPG